MEQAEEVMSQAENAVINATDKLANLVTGLFRLFRHK
jgi:hypothetical protein